MRALTLSSDMTALVCMLASFLFVSSTALIDRDCAKDQSHQDEEAESVIGRTINSSSYDSIMAAANSDILSKVEGELQCMEVWC